MDTVAIVSGGMDSTVLTFWLRARGEGLGLVTFDYGQRHGSKEIACAKGIAELVGQEHRIVDLTAITGLLAGSALTDDVEVPDGHYAEDTMRATVVPNRNAIMLNIAAGWAVAAGAGKVATAVHAGDHFIYPDCRPEFIEAVSVALRLGNEGFAVEGFRVVAPFGEMTKAEIVTAGHDLGVPFERTWSCYKGGEIHCGRCGTCVERIEAFALAKVPDPTEYADPVFALGLIEGKR